jgi:hypothetical protein
MFPAIGWVRANKAASEDLLAEINELRKDNNNSRKQNDELQMELNRFSSLPALENLAELQDEFVLFGTYAWRTQRKMPWTVTLTWSDIFATVAPYMGSFPTDGRVNEILTQAAFLKSKEQGYNPELNDQLFRTIALQLKALNLVEINYRKTVGGSMGLFWTLTPYGERLMLDLRTVKKVNASGNEEPK